MTPDEAQDENRARNELKVMVLISLADICKKVVENPAVPERLRQQAAELVTEFNLLIPHRGKGNADQHFRGERLLLRMAHFVPRICEIQSWPTDASNL